ncbi:MAG TPA: sulfotransferase [Patescibacteria group bacterium]|nr:sulfotransferase [Patescibacteria group bacterium]
MKTLSVHPEQAQAALPEEISCSANPKIAQRQIVVVLGMPRSGTSLLTNLLQGLGINLGDKLAAADANNPTGYWEHEDICQAQEDLLRQLGRRWIDPTGTFPLPSGWAQSPEAQSCKSRLAAIVEAELSRHAGLWGFKDPRTSRLLLMWQEIFAELNVEPVYVLAVREPASSIESLMKMCGIPAPHTELLWLLYNLDAVRDAGNRLRLVVDYDNWFSNPARQARAILQALNLTWKGSDDELLCGMRERVRPDLRHCRAARALSLPFSEKAYALLKRASVAGSISGELRRLDEEVRAAFALCGPWAGVASDLARPAGKNGFSFIDHFSEGSFESLGQHAQSAVWDVRVGPVPQRAIFLHPPGRLRFQVPDGRAARLSFGVAIHPDAWAKPEAGACQFDVVVDGASSASLRVSPPQGGSERCWRECVLDLPANPTGSHEVIFQTRAIGNFPWAVWREPHLAWRGNGVE